MNYIFPVFSGLNNEIEFLIQLIAQIKKKIHLKHIANE